MVAQPKIVRRWVRVAVAAALTGTGLAWAAPAAGAADSFTLSTLNGPAGYFQADGSCPKNTAKLRFEWSPGTSAKNYGEIAAKAGPVSVKLRMLATAPGETITVSLKCQTAGNKTKFEAGPFNVVSGTELLPIPDGTGSGRRIIYSLSAQQLWAVDADGNLARAYLVSGRRLAFVGKASQYGVFAVFSKSKMGCINGIRCPHMVRFRKTSINNVGFHAIPWSKPKGFWQTPAELGQPRSGGCVRARPEDAEWLFNWAQTGDPVHVIE